MQRSFYTIGYEGSQVEDFVRVLKRAGIQTLIDVRDVPFSRKPGFSKSSLAATLEAQGIGYVHLKGLGDPKPGRDAARASQYDLFRRIFAQHMTTEVAQRDFDRAVELVSERSCCLMCFEREHANCHRSIVADHIAERAGLAIHHLTASGVASRVVRLEDFTEKDMALIASSEVLAENIHLDAELKDWRP